jgi:hypothetical protein
VTPRRVLLIGEAPPPRGAAGGPAFRGRPARFLAGVAGEEVVGVCEAVNLIPSWPGRSSGGGSRFPAREARRRASSILFASFRGRIVLLAGRRVAAAFGQGRRPFLEWFALRGGRAAVLPHPSGLNRWWNSPENRRRAGALLRRGILLARDHFSCLQEEGPGVDCTQVRKQKAPSQGGDR